MIKTLLADADKAMHRRDREMKRFMAAQENFNKILLDINKEVADRFSYYAELFLDEKCAVVFDETGEYGKRRGPQLNAPHSAFYPVIDGKLRTSPSTLSEAQRLFVDLAFRMALLTTWSKRKKKNVTLIVETPEGSVDVAYMVRVAQMLRQFAKEGNVVIITTNLNNDEFLPALFGETPKSQRKQRIYNLLEYGIPKKVQLDHLDKFKRIIEKPYITDTMKNTRTITILNLLAAARKLGEPAIGRTAIVKLAYLAGVLRPSYRLWSSAFDFVRYHSWPLYR